MSGFFVFGLSTFLRQRYFRVAPRQGFPPVFEKISTPIGVVFFQKTLPLAQHEPLLAVRKRIVRFHNNLISINMTVTGKKTTIAEVEQWWSQADFTIMEIVTGFEYHNFVSEDGYQDFVDACDNYWNQLTNSEKIRVWNKYK